MSKICFDNHLYVEKQTEKILQRINNFNDKLYLEFGGKMFDDMHAARVLPGYDPNNKIKILQKLKDISEIIVCINANDITRNKIRADHGITYALETLSLIDQLRAAGLTVSGIIITLYENQPAADVFRQKLTRRGEKVYLHYRTEGYPVDLDTIVSEKGYGKNDFVPTSRPLVIVTAPGPGSGKLATCLSQMYHEFQRGKLAGYAKFETFPVWDLPLKHPVNIAYEAATADLLDVNMIDHFHLAAYGVTAINYNRDLETFPVVNNILYRILGKELYRSPTDMGVNMIAAGIVDDEGCCEAAKQEVVRRYYKTQVDFKQGTAKQETIDQIQLLINQLGISKEIRRCVGVAMEYAKKKGCPSFSIELPDGAIISGKQATLMSAESSCILNAIKHLAGIEEEVKLLPPQVIEPILHFNENICQHSSAMMTLDQTLVALAVSTAYSETSKKAWEMLPLLKNCRAHSSYIVEPQNEGALRKLGIDYTSEPVFITDKLYRD